MRWPIAAILMTVALLTLPTVASADSEHVSLTSATADKEISGSEVSEVIAKTTTSGASSTDEVFKVQLQCGADVSDPLCSNPRTCTDPPGSVRYDVLRSTDGGVTFESYGDVCLTNPPDVDGQVAVVTTAEVERAFKAIAWPPSGLEVQPPGGRTLVNLETNFFTTNTGPRSQTVTLLEQQVEIEATPTSWTWVHGDGTSQTTTTPGAAYPALEITHTYTDAGVSVAPQVDTTYSGRYRVGGGPWVAIPSTVTIAGVAGALEVVPAEPQLVAAE